MLTDWDRLSAVLLVVGLAAVVVAATNALRRRARGIPPAGVRALAGTLSATPPGALETPALPRRRS